MNFSYQASWRLGWRFEHIAAWSAMAAAILTGCAIVAAVLGAEPLALACGLLAVAAAFLSGAAWEVANDFQENNHGDGVYIHVDYLNYTPQPALYGSASTLSGSASIGVPYWAWMKPRT
jgi:hypothetical protein